jgi:hypothetical protein
MQLAYFHDAASQGGAGRSSVLSPEKIFDERLSGREFVPYSGAQKNLKIVYCISFFTN